MTSFNEKVYEITKSEPGENWCWWFLVRGAVDFELVQIYERSADLVKHGLFFSALDCTDATRVCHNLNESIGRSKTDVISMVESVSEELRKTAEANRYG